MELFQARFADRIVEDVFAEFSDRQALYRRKAFLVESFMDQAGDIVVSGSINGCWTCQQGLNRRACAGCDAFAFRPRGDPAN